METGPDVRCRSQVEASKGVQAVQAGLCGLSRGIGEARWCFR